MSPVRCHSISYHSSLSRMQTSGKQFGPVRVASDLLGEAGVAGFYRGVASPVVGAALIKSFVFGGYGFCQSIVRRARGKGSSGRRCSFSDADHGCSTDQIDTAKNTCGKSVSASPFWFFSPPAFLDYRLSFSPHLSARWFLVSYTESLRNVDIIVLHCWGILMI